MLADAVRLYTALPEAARNEVASRIASLIRKLIATMRADFAEGRFAEAVTKAELIRGIDARNVPAARLLARAVASYRKLHKAAVAEGDLPAQEDVCRRILAIEPNRADALRPLARLLANARRGREAIELYERLVRVEPDEPRHWHKLAGLCRAARRYDIGVPAALKAVELEPGNTHGLARLSDLLNRQALAA